jgi:hypothetical protein
MLGMLQGQQQQQPPPKYEVAREVKYTPWEKIYSPYGSEEEPSTEELLKIMRG